MNQFDKKGPEPWWIYRGTGVPAETYTIPKGPPWRQFTEEAQRDRAALFQVERHEIEMVNAALYLRRPLLITGKPGTGKTTLAYAVSYELNLGPVLLWPITSRSTLQDGLYRYDAIARLQDESLRQLRFQTVNPFNARSAVRSPEQAVEVHLTEQGGENVAAVQPDIGQYIRLGALGTAMALSMQQRPRALLIDEIDKSDIDLPNDLLHVFEEGEFVIPELARLPDSQSQIKVWTHDGSERIEILHGRVHCEEFPFIVMTSNGERDFPPAFLRRCLRLEIRPPDRQKLASIVAARLKRSHDDSIVTTLIDVFNELRERKKDLATDQLLNAIYLSTELMTQGVDPLGEDMQQLRDALLRSLTD